MILQEIGLLTKVNLSFFRF